MPGWAKGYVSIVAAVLKSEAGGLFEVRLGNIVKAYLKTKQKFQQLKNRYFLKKKIREKI